MQRMAPVWLMVHTVRFRRYVSEVGDNIPLGKGCLGSQQAFSSTFQIAQALPNWCEASDRKDGCQLSSVFMTQRFDISVLVLWFLEFSINYGIGFALSECHSTSDSNFTIG